MGRWHVDAASAGWGSELRQVALLLTSELVTNAVVHGGGPITLAVHDTSERLRVEVSDAGTHVPAPRGPSGTAENGRGLRLVEDLSTNWGSHPREGAAGKTLWFELEHSGADTGAPAAPGQRADRRPDLAYVPYGAPMTSNPDADRPGRSVQALTDAEHSLDQLLSEAHLCAPHQLPSLLARHGEQLGVSGAVVYLADLQEDVLVPFLGSDGPPLNETMVALGVDATLAGRAFQQVEVLTQDQPGGRARVWLPLLDGNERLGVLSVTVPDLADLQAAGGVLLTRLRRFASVAAELVMTNTLYGDTLVRLRRRGQMGLAAEMQWSLLPPLTFACHEVTISAALEPAYEVAGDTVDYAVDSGCVRIGVLDGMGHGLQSAQLASLSVAAYRNARRAERRLIETAQGVDEAVFAGFGGEAFTTAVLAELGTDTGLLSWVNAGHPEPLLLRDGRLVKTLHTEPAAPLGLGSSLAEANGTGGPRSFVIGVEQLEPGDRVLFYTDGVIEARSPEGDFFGLERLVDLLTRHLAGELPTPETMRRVVRALLAHQQGQLTDDATLLLLEWRSGTGQALQP